MSPHSSAREYFLLMRARAEQAENGTGDYADYRARKMRELDSEYAAYRREQQDRFDCEFDAWREKRKADPHPIQEPLKSDRRADESEKPGQ